jgi:hypothetical protein
MTYNSYRRQQPAGPRGLLTAKQVAALTRMAEANGFSSASALLADVASCSVAELGRKSRPVVQMFVTQAFERYGRAQSTDNGQ